MANGQMKWQMANGKWQMAKWPNGQMEMAKWPNGK
jgi:hypothetical protein